MRAIPREVNDALVSDAEHAYALGLWCADSYWWSSSIGLSNVEPELIVRFGCYLSKLLSSDRVRVRIYKVEGCPPDDRVLALTEKVSVRPAFKMRRTAYHVYVNSRPLVRTFFSLRENLRSMPTSSLGSYFGGRFDGDGSFGTTPRIAYTTEAEALVDTELLARAGVVQTSVLHYAKASEYCIYIHKADWKRFDRLIEDHSWKADRRFTL
jgi:hypothetical protein